MADPRSEGVSGEALTALVQALESAAGSPSAEGALAELARAARAATNADVALVRTASQGVLEAVAVAGPLPLAAELDGTRLPADELPLGGIDDIADAPPAVARAAARAGANVLLVLPVRDVELRGTLEVYRAGAPFDPSERAAAALVAAQAALVHRAFASGPNGLSGTLVRPALELAGEALAAVLDEAGTAAEVARVAADVVGAPVAFVWEHDTGGELRLVGSHGLDADAELEPARALAAAALGGPEPALAVPAEGLPAGCGLSTTLPLGHPPVGLLQLLFAPGDEPDAAQLARLTTFAVRAAHALRASARSHALELELERTRALLAAVGQASAELSLSRTLDTAVERVTALFDVERVALYLKTEENLLAPAAGRGVSGPHERIAERLLDAALGGARERAVVTAADARTDERLREVRDAVLEAGITAVLAAPLVVRGEVVGLLAVYPPGGWTPTENEEALVSALAGQLAVAVQNAQLHERATELSAQRESALASERATLRRMRALYEISRSFAQELSFEKTLEALATTVVDVLDVDAALISMPDARREVLAPLAIHVHDPQLADAVRAILFRPEPFGSARVQRLFRDGRPYRVARSHDILSPFLTRGWTAAVIPVATPAETIAALTVLSFRPGSPIGGETVEAGVAIAGQAALAIDNARLYQQQKEFADTMQRSLLPRERPAIAGLEVGEVYQSSARVDVGGDVYDFLALDDGRLAVVLGDVTGHGVEATADMAMAKFVFRSLVREHPGPADFLEHANDIVVDEIAPGKFITMTYVTVDPSRGEVICASAGHPAPRLVLPNGTVNGLEASGLVLGVDTGQRYEEARAELPSGSTIVLYTDGVVEARRKGELYGVERLDELLASRHGLSPRDLAHAVSEDARAWSGGELSDDLAVVVIHRA